jgi:hypothetical protein
MAVADGQIQEVGPGQVAVLAENLQEQIHATELSLFLVTAAWPESAGAWSEEQAARRL